MSFPICVHKKRFGINSEAVGQILLIVHTWAGVNFAPVEISLLMLWYFGRNDSLH